MTEIINNQRKMKVKFETDYKDFAEAIWIGSGYKDIYRNYLFNFICYYGIVAGLGSLPVLMFAPHFIFALLSFALIFSACFYFFRPPSQTYFVSEYKNIYGSKPFNYEVELQEDALKVSDNLSESTISWQRINAVIQSEDEIYLVFKHKHALKIPKTAFVESSKLGEFIAFATSRISSTGEALNDRNNQ